MQEIMLILKLVFLSLIVFAHTLPSDTLTQVEPLYPRNMPQIQRRTGIIADMISRFTEGGLVRSALRERLRLDRIRNENFGSLYSNPKPEPENNSDEVKFLRQLVVTLNNKRNNEPSFNQNQNQNQNQYQNRGRGSDDFKLKVIKMLLEGSSLGSSTQQEKQSKAFDRAKLLRVVLDELGQIPNSEGDT